MAKNKVEGESLLLLQDAIECLLKKDIKNAVDKIKKATDIIINKKVWELDLLGLAKYNISNDNTNPIDTTKGINEVLKYAKEKGIMNVKLPPGIYSIDTESEQGVHIMKNEEYGWDWGFKKTGVVMLDNITLDITDCILEMSPADNPRYTIVNFAGVNNANLIGGTVVGDRYTHDYGFRINDNKQSLEFGDYDETTGLPIEDNTKIRTIGYIDNYYGNELPDKFRILPLEGTYFNTTDGGRCYVYCYDENNEYLGKVLGGDWGGYLEEINIIEGTKKIKVSFWNESNVESKFYITTRELYYTHEFGTGILFTDAQNCTVKRTKVIDCIGDCVATNCPPAKYNNYNLQLIECTLENSRRQGISLTGDSELFIVKDCKIGYINGVDPQCGVDIEVEYGSARKVIFDNCDFYMNKRADFDNFNGVDTEIKNCIFKGGGIATVYGRGLKVHDSHFEYKKLEDNPKNWHPVPKSCGIGTSSEGDEIYNNVFVGAFCVTGKDCYNNIFKDNATLDIMELSNNNVFENSSLIIRDNAIAINETLNSSSVSPMGILTDSTLCDCNISVGTMNNEYGMIKDSVITNKTKTFTAHWGQPYVIDNCEINIEYNDDTAFISQCGNKSTYQNCIINSRISSFVGLNYNDFVMKECTINFNDEFENKKNTTFYNNVYGTATFKNNTWNKNFNYPTIKIPKQVNGIVNGNIVEESVTI